VPDVRVAVITAQPLTDPMITMENADYGTSKLDTKTYRNNS